LITGKPTNQQNLVNKYGRNYIS